MIDGEAGALYRPLSPGYRRWWRFLNTLSYWSQMSGFAFPPGRAGESFRFRVSDAVEVPMRGYLHRLRLLEG
jgi:hypothetical protein